MTALSALNVVLSILGVEFVFAYSAAGPLFALNFLVDEAENYTIIGIVAAFVILAFYFLCWLFSKTKPALLIAALAAFSIDTLLFAASVLLMFLDGELAFERGTVFGIIFQIWVLVNLITGVAAVSKLKKLSTAYVAPVEQGNFDYTDYQPVISDSDNSPQEDDRETESMSFPSIPFQNPEKQEDE
ncbi:MAG: hypothetical protein FWG82_06985 [Oscillospiraceae bacterium]|nr:hypothetical protein [Oscillospiraceae bacterium]